MGSARGARRVLAWSVRSSVRKMLKSTGESLDGDADAPVAFATERH